MQRQASTCVCAVGRQRHGALVDLMIDVGVDVESVFLGIYMNADPKTEHEYSVRLTYSKPYRSVLFYRTSPVVNLIVVSRQFRQLVPPSATFQTMVVQALSRLDVVDYGNGVLLGFPAYCTLFAAMTSVGACTVDHVAPTTVQRPHN